MTGTTLWNPAGRSRLAATLLVLAFAPGLACGRPAASADEPAPPASGLTTPAAGEKKTEPPAAGDERPAPRPKPGTTVQRATFGAGCFWCTEAVFQRVPGVKAVISGYAGGSVPNPT